MASILKSKFKLVKKSVEVGLQLCFLEGKRKQTPKNTGRTKIMNFNWSRNMWGMEIEDSVLLANSLACLSFHLMKILHAILWNSPFTLSFYIWIVAQLCRALSENLKTPKMFLLWRSFARRISGLTSKFYWSGSWDLVSVIQLWLLSSLAAELIKQHPADILACASLQQQQHFNVSEDPSSLDVWMISQVLSYWSIFEKSFSIKNKL